MAYRSRPRPSSTPGAKASTICPYYLDGDQNGPPARGRRTAMPSYLYLPTCAVFKDRRGVRPPGTPAAGLSKLSSVRRTPVAPSRPRPGRRSRRRPAHEAPRGGGSQRELPRKEVIQPHLPVRLPCYDFTPITSPTFDGSLPLRGWATGFGCCPLSWCDGRCVQGPGTYSPRHC